MKKIILTIISIIYLLGCQSLVSKKIDTSVPAQTAQEKVANVAEVLALLSQCNNNSECKKGLDAQLPGFLEEKNLIPTINMLETDEHDRQQLPNNVTLQNDESIPKYHLSNNYMSNELIKGALNEWLTWKRPQLISTWQYYQYFKNDMQGIFKKHSISEPLIIAIMSQESGGKVHSRSRAGAGGLFQLMPATAKRMGLHGKKGAYDLRFNPEKSAMAAAKYIAEQSQLYAGDEAKILAAYNSGENRFARLNKQYKNQSLWNKNFYYELPRETRHYIPVVIAAMLIFQDPEKFNVRLEAIDSELITIKLANKTSLSELSVCLGQEQRSDGWFRVLRNINSGVKADKTIDANIDILIPKTLESTFNKNCLNKELMQLARSFHDSDFKGNQGLFSYRVKKGDSLSRIARKFRSPSKKEIARLNHLKAPRYLNSGRQTP